MAPKLIILISYLMYFSYLSVALIAPYVEQVVNFI